MTDLEKAELEYLRLKVKELESRELDSLREEVKILKGRVDELSVQPYRYVPYVPYQPIWQVNPDHQPTYINPDYHPYGDVDMWCDADNGKVTC
jgi:LPS O-antigen subunit length determinant protein (WzzB/FepE family)